MTIRKRLTVWYAVLLTIIIILFGAITYGVMRVTMIRNIDASLEETASLILRNSRLSSVPEFGAANTIYIELAELDVFRASGVHVQAWKVSDSGYELVGKSANLAPIDVPLDPDALGYNALGGHFSNVILQGVRLRVLTMPIFLSGRLVGNIQLGVDLATVNQSSDLLLLIMLVSCGFAILGAMALSMWFSHRALEPIEEITRAASGIAGTNDLSTRLTWEGPNDELGRLVSVFNHMMGRIEHLFSVQQRFVADVSHELRTPLTAIQGNVELIQRYGVDEASLEAIEAETARMSRLINDLLMLARADYGGMEIELYPLDLDTILLDVFNQGKVLAKDRDLKIKLDHFEPLRIKGNADRIKQMMLNLMDNALKFTPDGGEVSLGLRHDGDNALMWIKDTGIGMTSDDLERIFDRFYQSDPARTHTGGGFGLGLSIAKWIADAHHAHITVTSLLNQGTTFTIIIPIEHPHIEAEDSHEHVTRPRLPILRRNIPETKTEHHEIK